MTITSAKLENVPEIIALCYKDFDEVGESLPKPNTFKAVESMSYFINEGLVFVKKEENGKIVGVLALTPFDFWWSEVPVLHTAVLYVLPEYRKFRVADELIEEAKSFADVMEVTLYFDIPLTKMELKSKYLEKKGFVKSGEVLRYSNN